jgi:enoyl-CoA hydratase/carnithine racemase
MRKSPMDFSTLRVSVEGPVGHLQLHRPDKANAMNLALWEELPRAAAWLDEQSGVRVVVLSAAGRHFTAGIDFEALAHLGQMTAGKGCPARAREQVWHFIRRAQASFTRIEQLRVPVIAAIQGACIGAGVDLISACDLRLCSADARFSIKEVDLAIAADVGTLQRLRHLIGLSHLSELAYTGETFDAARAERLGLVSRVLDDADALHAAALELAQTLAAKSPLTLRGIKHNLLYSRDHSVAEGLEHIALWNASMLVSHDATEAMMAQAQKRAPRFAD